MFDEVANALSGNTKIQIILSFEGKLRKTNHRVDFLGAYRLRTEKAVRKSENEEQKNCGIPAVKKNLSGVATVPCPVKFYKQFWRVEL